MHQIKNSKRDVMVGGAAAFLVIALLAAATGHSGLAAMAVNIAWILFLCRLLFAAVFHILGESPRQRHGSRDAAR